VRAGRTTTVWVYGENLAPKEAAVPKPAVVQIREVKAAEGEAKKWGARVVALEITLPEKQPLENIELTLTQPDGQSVKTPLAVVENTADEITTKRPNHTFAQAMPVEGTSLSVLGTLEGDAHHLFRFEAKEGERWEIRLLAGRAGSALDAIVRIRDSRRIALQLSAGHPRRDRRLTFRVPMTGTFYIELTDAQGRTGANFAYRLILLRSP
jgi:hypothetical protein